MTVGNKITSAGHKDRNRLLSSRRVRFDEHQRLSQRYDYVEEQPRLLSRYNYTDNQPCTSAIAIAIAKLIYIAPLTLTTIVQQCFIKTKKIQKYNIKQRQC